MRSRPCIALLLLLSACAASTPSPKETGVRRTRLANLQRAAELPWRDEGQCVVQEASQPWSLVVERCFHALDTRKVRFRDTERRCPVASADAATLETLVGICLLTQPELVVGAVVVLGAVVVAVTIAEALEGYELKGVHSGEGRPGPGATAAAQESSAQRRPKPESSSSGQDGRPPMPPALPERARHPECVPRPVPHLGGDALHNQCADGVPRNGFPGSDVLVNGKRFDALQPRERVLWEVKTDNFDTYSPFHRKQGVENQVLELQRERELARACGFDFRVGVRSAAHRDALEFADNTLVIVIMDWC